ncbi:hypothetical protein GIB67_029293 [Kingdonia uniflora]|uniref:S-protein homolog n=1 Tax=Kingdonia uniflora TaxID=39325 RepID=A0A7J7N8S7_9MAGN|nr:hypothetical protein GIB67_029293 [Kingdonia uniflora]
MNIFNRTFGLMVLILFVFFDSVASDNVHVSVKNKLGDGKNLTVHCQSKDNDLGEQTLTDGSEYGWDFSVNAWGSTLFYCDITWETVNRYHFDSYSYDRDWKRCESQCLWTVSGEGKR